MNNNLKVLLIVVFAVGALYVGKKVFFPNDRELVLELFSSLEEKLLIERKSPPLEMLTRAGNVGKHFTDKIHLSYNFRGSKKGEIYKKEDLIQRSAALNRWVNTFEVRFNDITVEIPEKDRATATMTVHVIYSTSASPASSAAGENREEMAEEMEFRLLREDGSWLISEAENVETVEY